MPTDDLFILAMDHRDSLARELYRIHGEPTPADDQRIAAGKALIFRGLLAALERGAEPAHTGVLVDERYGADIARQARPDGLTLAMPVERSGQKVFTLEYGHIGERTWTEHVARFDPDHVKVLVRDNPDNDAADRQTQFDRLAVVSRTLHDTGRSFLVELLVPATDRQLASVAGDAGRYDFELRPDLTARVIHAMQVAGVEPHIWKVEGLETAAAAAQIVAAAWRDGRDAVRCIVLGRDAPAERLNHWLKIAAATNGFHGFAIGRSIWEQLLADHLAGHATDDELIDRVATSYLHYVAVYRKARARR